MLEIGAFQIFYSVGARNDCQMPGSQIHILEREVHYCFVLAHKLVLDRACQNATAVQFPQAPKASSTFPHQR